MHKTDDGVQWVLHTVLYWVVRHVQSYMVNVGGSAASKATRLTLGVPPAELAEWCVRAGRPSGLQGSVAGDVNPRGWWTRV